MTRTTQIIIIVGSIGMIAALWYFLWKLWKKVDEKTFAVGDLGYQWQPFSPNATAKNPQTAGSSTAEFAKNADMPRKVGNKMVLNDGTIVWRRECLDPLDKNYERAFLDKSLDLVSRQNIIKTSNPLYEGKGIEPPVYFIPNIPK